MEIKLEIKSMNVNFCIPLFQLGNKTRDQIHECKDDILNEEVKKFCDKMSNLSCLDRLRLSIKEDKLYSCVLTGGTWNLSLSHLVIRKDESKNCKFFTVMNFRFKKLNK